MLKPGAKGPAVPGITSPAGSEPNLPVSRRIGEDPSGSFRRASETFKAAAPSSANMLAASRVTKPDAFDSASPRCRCLVRVMCSPGSDSLESMHQFLTGYARGRFRLQLAQRLSVAGYELLANALNYSSMADEVVIELFDVPESAAIRVTNETIQPRVAMLSEHMNKLRINAEATLVEEMRRSVAGGPVRPMLGLARVVHEVNMELDFVVRERRVTMAASCRK